jgi:hypothetical protein
MLCMTSEPPFGSQYPQQPPSYPSGQSYPQGQPWAQPQASWGGPVDAAQAAAQAAAGQANSQVMVTIGDIVCTNTQVITPSGQAPIGGVVWSYTDMSRTTRSIPTWAIVCTVIFFFFCLLGLLFLLAKEDRTEGTVQVVVQGQGFLHQVQLPVSSVMQVQDYAARVNYARSLSAAAAGR